MGATYITTERLLLRAWTPQDLSPFAALNQDAEVMRYFPRPLSQGESAANLERMQALIEAKGWGFWAIEDRQSGAFIGMTGLHQQGAEFPNGPLVEIGWRIARRFWRQGYALEAASASLDFAFDQLNLSVVHAFTPLLNIPSWRLMERLGMWNSDRDFDHPRLAQSDPLCRHCLYMISAKAWRERRDRSPQERYF